MEICKESKGIDYSKWIISTFLTFELNNKNCQLNRNPLSFYLRADIINRERDAKNKDFL